MTEKYLTPNARVITEDDGTIKLYSYYTLVITLTPAGWLTCTGTYTKTTVRHIGLFMAKYITLPNGNPGNYYIAKGCYLGKYRWNAHTGEVEFLNSRR